MAGDSIHAIIEQAKKRYRSNRCIPTSIGTAARTCQRYLNVRYLFMVANDIPAGTDLNHWGSSVDEVLAAFDKTLALATKEQP